MLNIQKLIKKKFIEIRQKKFANPLQNNKFPRDYDCSLSFPRSLSLVIPPRDDFLPRYRTISTDETARAARHVSR